MAEFLHMGGHGFFVWTSYALALVALVALPLSARRRLRALLREVRAFHENSGRRP